MIRLGRFRPAGATGFLGICCLFFLSPSSYAQDTTRTGSTNAPPCKVADLETSVQFINGPGNYFTVAFNMRNISDHSCVQDGPLYGPSFAPDRVPGEKPFALCYYCEERLPNGQHPAASPLTLDSDQLSHLTFRWKVVAPDETVQCLHPNWMTGPMQVEAPALLKKICSDIDVGRYGPGPFRGSAPMEDQTPDEGQTQLFELTSDRSIYYEGESFYLHASLVEPSTPTPSNTDSCPALYLWERSPDGGTRFDPAVPAAFKGCGTLVLGMEPSDWQSGFELDSGARSRWGGLGEHTFEIFQVAGSPDDGQIHFFHSNILHIQIADASIIPRKWGPMAKGLAVDVTVDKDTFRLGEDVPLHIALENFDATAPVYGPDPAMDPCSVVGIEVHGAGGETLSMYERFPDHFVCMGHGASSRYLKGKVIPLERTLDSEGWLPNHPGIYTVVVTWAPWDDSKNESTVPGIRALGPDEKPYAIARSSTTILIVGRDGSPSK